jgi:acetolactate synthase I/II/III large subunit
MAEMKREYGSDLIVDILKQYDIEYISFNPGSSFRGLHESIVNYGGNKRPELVECTHEEVAVQIAHGYARAKQKPMAAILHNFVGLLHGTMAIYYAYLDRVPIIMMGATGPLDITKRRARTDWIHTVSMQSNVIRDYVKWEDQPFNIQSTPEAMVRAYRAAMTEPMGPVYVCFDTSIQEEKLPSDVEVPNVEKLNPPTSLQADLDALRSAAKMITEANFPLILADDLGRNFATVDELIQFSDLLGLPVIDLDGRFNFPSTHPMDLTTSTENIPAKADLILALDVPNFFGAMSKVDSLTRESKLVIRDDTHLIQLGLNDLKVRGFVYDHFKLQPVDLQIAGDTSVALPKLREFCSEALTPASHAAIKERKEKIRKMHDEAAKHWQDEAKRVWNEKPISTARYVAEVWNVIKNEDWVLSCATLVGKWARRLWNWEKPYCYTGRGWGTSTNIGMSVGVALAHKGTERVVVDLQPDGDLMFDPGALWTACHHSIPFLIVMNNNRGYWNDWEHQIRLSKFRERPVETANIGVEIGGPDIDFAYLARSMGCYAEGPIEDSDKIQDAVRRALEAMRKTLRPALVDVVCQPR